jgi:hypothetical protein
LVFVMCDYAFFSENKRKIPDVSGKIGPGSDD